MLSSQQLAELWRQHSAALLLMARPYSDFAEDCVQEAFIRLATQESVPDSPLAWLVQVVRNESINQLKSRHRRHDREAVAASRQPRWFESTKG